MNETALIEKVIAGDNRAYDLLMRPYLPMIRRRLVRMLRNEADADDVLQDVMLRVYRFVHKFSGDCKFSTWLYRVVSNTALNEIEARKSRPLQFSDDEEGEAMLEQMAVDEDTPDALLEGKQFAEHLTRVLARMPRPHAETLYLREIEQLSHPEIIARQGCQLGTIRSRLHRAREAIREEMRISV